MSVFVTNKYNKTLPYIHHCPLNTPEEIWDRLASIAMRMKTTNLQKPEDLTIITFNNTSEKMLLQRQLELTNTDYVLLGGNISRRWKNTYKISLLNEHLSKVSTKYVLVMDASDVLVTRPLNRLISDFSEFDCRVLYNASSVIYPSENVYSQKENAICSDFFNHLNSGCFVGETEFCKNLYTKVEEFNDAVTTEHYYSDQIKLKAMYVNNPKEIMIDSKCSIFQVFHWKDTKCDEFLDITVKVA